MIIVLAGNMTYNNTQLCTRDRAIYNRYLPLICDLTKNSIEHMENVASKIILRIEDQNEDGNVTGSLQEIARKIPVISLNHENGAVKHICKDRIIDGGSIRYLADPWKICPVKLRDQDYLSIMKGLGPL